MNQIAYSEMVSWRKRVPMAPRYLIKGHEDFVVSQGHRIILVLIETGDMAEAEEAELADMA